jgi:hypothetical protein
MGSATIEWNAAKRGVESESSSGTHESTGVRGSGQWCGIPAAGTRASPAARFGPGTKKSEFERVFGARAIPSLTAPHPPALIACGWQGLRIDPGHPTPDFRSRHRPVACVPFAVCDGSMASHPSPEKDREAREPSPSTLHFALVHGGCGHKAAYPAVKISLAGRVGGCERCTFRARGCPGVVFSR